MRRTLQNNNKSLMSIIPKEIVEDLGLKIGDILDFRLEGKKIIAIPVHYKRQSDNGQVVAIHKPTCDR